MNTAFSPSNTEDELALSGPSSMRAMLPRRISVSPRWATTSWPKAWALFSDVWALIVNLTKSPLIWPGAEVKLLAARAARTSLGVMFSPAMRSGSSQTRMAKVWPPRIWALATPSMVWSRGCTTRIR